MDHIHGKYIKIPREYKYAYWSDNHKTLHKTETFDIVYYQTTTSKMKTMKKKKHRHSSDIIENSHQKNK